MINTFFTKIKNYYIKKKWRRGNSHNFTTISRANSEKYIDVGNFTYGVLNVHISNSKNKLRVGNFCSIASNVYFLLSADHNIGTVSSYPFKSQLVKSSKMEGVSKGDIIVDDDVWIGYGATIMSGVHIGQGAVVAAGAVVTKDVPPYAIVGGVPANVIKYRFEPGMIEELLKVDYSNLTKEMIEEHIDDLYTEVTAPSQLDWMPKQGNSIYF